MKFSKILKKTNVKIVLLIIIILLLSYICYKKYTIEKFQPSNTNEKTSNIEHSHKLGSTNVEEPPYTNGNLSIKEKFIGKWEIYLKLDVDVGLDYNSQNENLNMRDVIIPIDKLEKDNFPLIGKINMVFDKNFIIITIDMSLKEETKKQYLDKIENYDTEGYEIFLLILNNICNFNMNWSIENNMLLIDYKELTVNAINKTTQEETDLTSLFNMNTLNEDETTSLFNMTEDENEINFKKVEYNFSNNKEQLTLNNILLDDNNNNIDLTFIKVE